MPVTISREPTDTHTLRKSGIVLSSVSTIQIDASADHVFEAILDAQRWSSWAMWYQAVKFTDGGEQLVTGSTLDLVAGMESQGRTYTIPVQVRGASRCVADMSSLKCSLDVDSRS